jgi:hypothetical protein
MWRNDDGGSYKMKILHGILAGLMLSLGVSAESKALSAIEASYAYILINGADRQAVKLSTLAAAKELNYLSESFLDIVAEILSQRHAAAYTDKEIKRDLWMLLYESGNARYLKLLVQTGLLIEHHEVRLALQELTHKRLPADVAAYTLGTVSLDQLIQHHTEAGQTSAQKPTRNLAAIQMDMNAGEVTGLLGAPQAADAENVGSFLNQHVQLIWLYRGQGAVLLKKAGGRNSIEPALTWKVSGIISDPYSYEYIMAYSRFATAAAREKSQYVTLLYAGGLGLRRLLESWDTQKANVDTELLDIAAERLLQEYRHSSDADTLQGLVLLTKILARSGAGRYATVMQEISQHASHRKLKDATKRSGATLTQGAPQYLQNRLDLAELRKKYPPPY